MCYLLDFNGLPSLCVFGLAGLVSIFLSIYTFQTTDCAMNAPTLSVQSWLLVNGICSTIFSLLFYAQNHYLQDTCVCFRRIMFALVALFCISWTIVGLVVFAQGSENKALHDGSTHDCFIPAGLMFFFLIPCTFLQFGFYALVICFPLRPDNYYTYTTAPPDGDYSQI